MTWFAEHTDPEAFLAKRRTNLSGDNFLDTYYPLDTEADARATAVDKSGEAHPKELVVK